MSSIPSSPSPSPAAPHVDIPEFLEAVRRPAVTVLCGSTRFAEAFAAATLAETLAGNVVLSIGCDLRTETALTSSLSTSELVMLKDGLDELYRRKIEMADQVLILNVGGYVGDSTRSEINYARDLDKPVRFLEPVCDNTSVAVLIRDQAGRALVFERATFPPGVACAAGHIDDHGEPSDAAIAEVHEELGLTVTTWNIVTHAKWRPNRCRRHPSRASVGPADVGHYWWVVVADVEGDLAPSQRETRNARWATPAQLQDLAQRTVAYAHGRITDEEFTDQPGIEPVQVQWFADAGLVDVDPENLVLIEELAARGGLISAGSQDR